MALLYRDVRDGCWRCGGERVVLEPNLRGSYVVFCAAPDCIARTTSAKPTIAEALLQWTVSSRRQLAKARKERPA
jgi:hypothetical protein